MSGWHFVIEKLKVRESPYKETKDEIDERGRK